MSSSLSCLEIPVAGMDSSWPQCGRIPNLNSWKHAPARHQDDQRGKRGGLGSLCVFSRALAYPDLT